MKHWELKSISDLVFLREEEPDSQLIADGSIPIVSKIKFEDGEIELRENGKSNTKLISVHPNDIIISGINAQKGAIAVNNFDKIVAATIHYSAYEVNKTETTLDFFYSFLRSHFFQELLKEKLYSGIKTEVKPSKFLSLKVPFPDLGEQKLIQSKISAIKERADIIRKLKTEQKEHIQNLSYSYFFDVQQLYPSESVNKYLIPKEFQIIVDPLKSYKQVTAKWWNNGAVLRKESLGSEMSSKQFLVNKDDFIISKIDARHGAYGIIPDELDGAAVTGDFPVFEIKEINPDYLDFVTKSNYFLEECKKNSQGTTRRVRLNMDKFLEIKIPVPPPEIQEKIVELVAKVNTIEQHNVKLEKELNELLPSVIDKAFKGEL